MKLPLALLPAPAASAHYIFHTFSSGGVTGAPYEFVRENINYNSPVIDLPSTDLRCHEGGLDGSDTNVLPVTAGSSFTFTADVAVYHNGPTSL